MSSKTNGENESGGEGRDKEERGGEGRDKEGRDKRGFRRSERNHARARNREDERGLVPIGEVVSPHGVSGGMKLRCYSDSPRDLTVYGSLHDGKEVRRVVWQSFGKGYAVMRLDEVFSRELAELWRGRVMYVLREWMPSLDVDEYYHTDLRDLLVLDEEGESLGRVDSIGSNGVQSIVEIRLAGGEWRRCLFTRENVPCVNVEEGYMEVRREALVS